MWAEKKIIFCCVNKKKRNHFLLPYFCGGVGYDGLVLESDPIDVNYLMHATQAYCDGDEEPIDSTWFKGVIGALLYLATMTRPDTGIPTYKFYKNLQNLQIDLENL